MARLLVVPDTKTAFRSAISAHEPTETQFREVARILANASNVGMSHQLWRDWASIRQEWNDTVQLSRLNARQCSTFMQDMAGMFTSNDLSSFSVDRKQQIVETFLEDIPQYIEGAKDVASGFRSVKAQVETFPSKVYNVLKPSWANMWNRIWEGVRRICGWIVARITELLRIALDNSKFRGEFVGTVPIGIGQVEINLDELWKQCLKSATTRPPPGRRIDSRSKLAEADVAHLDTMTSSLSDDLSKQEQVWRIAEQMCITLRDQFKRANKILINPPKGTLCDPMLSKTHAKFTLLAECLEGYATGGQL